MSPKKKPAEPKPEEYADWYPKHLADGGKDPHWIRKLTPAERRQFDAEVRWASRVYNEDLPGPTRVDVIDDFF